MSMPEQGSVPSRSIPLLARVQVSLRAGLVLALANILCVAILAWAYTRAKAPPKVINVTGSAKRTIQSDLIVWTATVSVNDPDLVRGYGNLETSAAKAVAYLTAAGVPNANITIGSVYMKKNFARDEKGNSTDKVSTYDLTQPISVRSTDVLKTADVARGITRLIKEGVTVESDAPQFLYTKLADLKVQMLADATKDATSRAKQIADNSDAGLGSIRSARMGVIQINPVNSTDVSYSGNNDTTSYEKDITAVVAAEFELR